MTKVLKALVALGILAVIIAAVGYVRAQIRGAQYAKGVTSCLSNMKEVGKFVALYSADHDECLPPYYAFTETPGPDTAKLLASISRYAKGDSFSCPVDKSAKAGTLGYVNPRSLMGLIPEYADGKRVLNLATDVADLRNTPFLRDPVRGSQKVFPPNGTPVDALTSPHEAAFILGYLDGHAARKPMLDMRSDL